MKAANKSRSSGPFRTILKVGGLALLVVIFFIFVMKEQAVGLLYSVHAYLPTEELILSGDEQLCELAVENVEQMSPVARSQLKPFFMGKEGWTQKEFKAAIKTNWWINAMILSQDQDFRNQKESVAESCFQKIKGSHQEFREQPSQ